MSVPPKTVNPHNPIKSKRKNISRRVMYNQVPQVLTCSVVSRVLLNTGTLGAEEKQKQLLQELERENRQLTVIEC